MFDFVHENKRLVQIILLLIILPFALWGISSYRQTGGGGEVATVDGEKITRQELDNAVRQAEPAVADKRVVLERLINQKLLELGAHSAGLRLGDEQVAQVVRSYREFQKNGKFDRQQYEDVLRRQGMSPAVFEARVKQDLAVRMLAETYLANGYASSAAADGLIRLEEQQRVVSVAQIPAETFLKQAKVDDAEIKSYYDANAQEFRTPEQARVDYIMFSAKSLLSQVSVDDKEIRDYYDSHQAEFSQPEQRHVAHILIAVPAQAPDAAKQAARAKAEELLARLKKDPASFARLAKENSQDSGSAAAGGDLGFLGRGMMPPAFDEAVFGLKAGETSGVVQTSSGFHLIKVLAIKPKTTLSLQQVKEGIAQKLKQQKAADKFAELADKFSNTVYEQSDSLKPAAELVKEPVQQSGWLNNGQAGAPPWTDKALQAVFSDDVLKKKRNSPAVEIAPDTLLAVHLLDYRPAATRSLADVRDAIRDKLLRQRAAELAAKQGQAVLAQLQHGEKVALKWGAAETVTRMQPPRVDPKLANLVLQADVAKLPVYVGVETAQGGYAIARVDSVKETGPIDDAKRASVLAQLRQMTGEELLRDYLADARKEAKVSVGKFAAEGQD